MSTISRFNLEYIESLYDDYLNEKPIDEKWSYFFQGMDFNTNRDTTLFSSNSEEASVSTDQILKELNLYRLIRAYRDYGHFKAQLDPLNLTSRTSDYLNLSRYGFSEKDMETRFQASSFLLKPNMSLREVLDLLEKTYCGTLAFQVAQCPPNVRDWFYKEMESENLLKFSNEEKIEIFKELAKTESLEKFLHTRYVGMKRFSVEGTDAVIQKLEHLVQISTSLGIKEYMIGMAPRGRLNILSNFMDKGLDIVLSEFEGNSNADDEHEGDVKYHLGYTNTKSSNSGQCRLELAFNPSHLEAVSPVVLGMTRARQRVNEDTKDRKSVVPILIHGDAAFAGQGVVVETLQLSQLKGYTVGGSLHIILNNQVGFTTNPSDSRSTTYSSDTAKAIKAPILLVNADDAEACIRAIDMAIRFRQEFKQDVVIEVYGYRRFGHNEGDEPSFTQPQMYKVIKKHPTIRNIYAEKLDKEQILSIQDSDAFFQQKIDNLQVVLDSVRANPPVIPPEPLIGLWEGFKLAHPDDLDKTIDTKVDEETLQSLVTTLTEEPTKITVHKKIKKLLSQRKQMVDEDRIDWGMGELLAYASLCQEGHKVRLSGQDCKRGTFTHRHAVYFDQESGEEFTPIKTINSNKSEFCVYNSNLSEMAVLGYEYGNSSSDPKYLTIWEAQFGDFANGAQIIIDQFITSGETKWSRMSGITMLLPHGYEGQGPEHSSARLERFLQLCAQENIQVCNLTTPANLFHALRRQQLRDFRKPLIIMSPKSLLRHPQVVSKVSDFTDGEFQTVILDPHNPKPKKVETLIFCSGKIYFDIEKTRDGAESQRLALHRLEQIYPFPHSFISEILSGYPKLKRVIWCQEEPMNNGAYTFVNPLFQNVINESGLKVELQYIGRKSKASPATGSARLHAKSQNEIINKCLEYL